MSFSMRNISITFFVIPSLVLAESFSSDSHSPSFETKVGQTYLCIARASTGFDWVDGKWTLKNFRPEKWLVRKGDKSTSCDLSNEIDTNSKSSDFWNKKYDPYEYWELKRCYSLKKFGSNDDFGSLLNTNLCSEFYDAGEKIPFRISCEKHAFHSFAFKPHGEFLLITKSSLLPKNKNSSVGSNLIEAGSCEPL